jgi:exopolyphosphatase/guanosine-5'-triphosphate,3'-diphosphate pyrophosphatase
MSPRWEWRTLTERSDDAERRFETYPQSAVRESDEQYLLSLDREVSAKIRDGLMDVKVLDRRRDDGLEQWRPIMKAEFPISADQAATLLEALGAGPPPAGRATFTLDELLSDVIGPNPRLRAVAVHKLREHTTIAGAMAERSTLTVDGSASRTIAVEEEDPDLVMAAAGEVGIAGRTNVAVPRVLAALAGFGAQRFAVIDVGTNSVKFHVGERAADATWRTIADRAEVTRLGEGLAEHGRFGDAPIERTVAAIAGMVDEARAQDVAAIAAVGTAGMRQAANSAAFVDAVRARTGIEVEVISGADEARLAYRALRAGLPLGSGPLVALDSGGGSSQFTFARGEQVEEQFSLDVGAVNVTERYGLAGAVDDATLDAALDGLRGELARVADRGRPDTVVGMGGTITNLVAVQHELAAYDPDVVHGATLTRAEVDRQVELYRSRSADERRGIHGLQPNRAEVILGGACIVRTALELLGAEALLVNDRGLRYGLLAERFSS